MTATLLARQLLVAAQSRTDTSAIRETLEKLSVTELSTDLQSDSHRKAFWINCYNAFVQILLSEKQVELLTLVSRHSFFNRKSMVIANQFLSLNDIEHGLLRNSSVWWSYGYLRKPVIGTFERKFRVKLDHRIHFALNCGATSCPAIRFYAPEKIDEQLDMATSVFLTQDTQFDKQTGTVTVSEILKFYRGDFGGKKGILRILRQQQLIPADQNVSLRFHTYDWRLLLDKFAG